MMAFRIRKLSTDLKCESLRNTQGMRSSTQEPLFVKETDAMPQILLLQLQPRPFLASKVQSLQLRGTCPSSRREHRQCSSTRGLVQHGPSPQVYYNGFRAENTWDTAADSYTFWTPCLACCQEGGDTPRQGAKETFLIIQGHL